MSNPFASPIDNWLQAMNARDLHTAKSKIGTYTLYDVNGRYLVIRRWTDKSGWEAFIPACEENNVEKTLDALTQHFERKNEPVT